PDPARSALASGCISIRSTWLPTHTRRNRPPSFPFLSCDPVPPAPCFDPDRHVVTVAHSVTLIASAYNLGPTALWFPPLIETLIAMSIVYMALENIVGSNVRRRWMITFGFGLVHGFGFSFALRETLQFAGSYLLTS